jgi:Protein of unknown function (DUF3106)
MRLGRFFAAIAGAALLAGIAAQPAFSSPTQRHPLARPLRARAWQETKPAPSAPAAKPRQDSAAGNKGFAGRGKEGAAARGEGDGRGMAGLPPKWVDRLRDMSPEEQERFMRNNQRFQSLPPARQAQVRKNLETWNRLSPTERNAIRDRERTWEQMSPEQRRYVQDVLLPKWKAMPQERRTLINGRLHVLQGMTTAQQKEALDSPRFMQGLSSDEQQMLREVNSLRNPPLQ